jgi:hypothetical protein
VNQEPGPEGQEQGDAYMSLSKAQEDRGQKLIHKSGMDSALYPSSFKADVILDKVYQLEVVNPGTSTLWAKVTKAYEWKVKTSPVINQQSQL